MRPKKLIAIILSCGALAGASGACESEMTSLGRARADAEPGAEPGAGPALAGDDCATASPAGCGEERPCPAGMLCVAPPEGVCLPAFCRGCGAGWSQRDCAPGCGGGVCVVAEPDGPAPCDGPNPAGCNESNPCALGAACVLPPDGTCRPSACRCLPSGEWACVDDCGGGVCVPAIAPPAGARPVCPGRNPGDVGCGDAGQCPAGAVCAASSVCVPGGCRCDVTTGAWACASECGGGGQCVPDGVADGSVEGAAPAWACFDRAPIGCNADSPCPAGTKCIAPGGLLNLGSLDVCGCDGTSGHWNCLLRGNPVGVCVPAGD